LDHLQQHKEYYNRLIWLSEDPLIRAARFDNAPYKWDANSALLDHLDNRAVEIISSWMAFSTPDKTINDTVQALVAPRLGNVEEPDQILNERLITLPTRGLFAEAKLGHCNASEEIDNTRFWDWQTSPIPHLAPEIAPVTPVTPQPQQQNLQPTAFPQSLVNIVNPPSEPDPTGLAAALNVLATPNIFRDMSGQALVEDLLKKLSDNTISIAQASNMARQIQQNRSAGGSAPASSAAGALAGTSGFGSRANPTQPAATNRDLQDYGNVLQQAVGKGLISQDNANSAFTSAANRPGAGQPLLAFQIPSGAAISSAAQIDLTPIHADENGQLLATYQFGDFLIFTPLGSLGPNLEIDSTKVHVFFAAGGVLGDAGNDVLIHGLRGSSNSSDWITIAVRGKTTPDGKSIANPISDSDIINCLQSIGVSSTPTSLRLTGHSRGCDSLIAALTNPKMITTKALIDRITFLDEAVEHQGDKSLPNFGAVTFNRVSLLTSVRIPAAKIVAYEVGNKSINTATGASAKVVGATYLDLGVNCMASVGAVRLILDAITLKPDIATRVAANATIQNQITSLPLPPRGSFTTKGAAGQIDLAQFCANNAAAITAITNSASKANESLVEFVNNQDLTGYVRASSYRFLWGVAAHHFFVAEIAHELFD
jgi:hypothetical protein